MHRANENRADLRVGGKRIWQNLGMMTTESSHEECETKQAASPQLGELFLKRCPVKAIAFDLHRYASC
jgi:hypothetical protein